MKRAISVVILIALSLSLACCKSAETDRTPAADEYADYNTTGKANPETDPIADPETDPKTDPIADLKADPEADPETDPMISSEKETSENISTGEKEITMDDNTLSTPTPTPTPLPVPVFGYIDAHADTITRALQPKYKAGLYSNVLHVDFERLLAYGAPVQVFVLWCADRYVDNAYEYTNSLIDFFESELEKHSDVIELALSLDDLERIGRSGKISALMSIEGGEALMGDISNLDHFYDRGVRIFGPTWNRENALGYGQETNSKEGLKPFGIEVVRRVEELGMILDVSHLNEAGFWDAHNNSTKPYMASHSNCYALVPHNRNLRDDQIKAIADRGGIIGIALYPEFLVRGNKVNAGIPDVLKHIGHFIELGAGGNIGSGSDFDGFSNMPDGITDVSSMKSVAEAIKEAYGEDVSTGVMWRNFYDFFVRFYRGS